MMSVKKNFVWTREPGEAYQNPYEYEAQKQFSRESLKVLKGFKAQLELYNGAFTIDDKSLDKALWMLHLDALDTLVECQSLLSENRHKIASRLFRDALEVLDLAALFFSGTEKSKTLLQKWYDDKVIQNSEYRQYIRKTIGNQRADELGKIYGQLSNFNHRTYRSLAYGYIRGKDFALVYDGFMESGILIFPGVIAMYYTLLANLIDIASIQLEKCGLIQIVKILEIWNDSIEPDPVERRFELKPPKKSNLGV